MGQEVVGFREPSESWSAGAVVTESTAAAYNTALRREGVGKKLHQHLAPASCHNLIGQTQPEASQQRHGGLVSQGTEQDLEGGEADGK